MDGGAILSLVVIFVCIALSAFASAAETSLTGVRRSRIQQLAEEEHDKRARVIASLLQSPQYYLTTILVLNSVAVIVASSLATSLAIQYLPPRPSWLHEVFSSVIMSLIVLICAELTPKILAIQNTERTALRLGAPVNFFALVLRPLVAVLNAVTGFIVKLLGGHTSRLDHFYTEEELRMLVEVGEEQGVLAQEETAMIHGVFEFGDTLVREVMRPRIDVVAVETEAPLEEVLQVAMKAGHSRIPMYEESIDNIIGVLYVKDLLRYLLPGATSSNLRSLAREPFFVPESQRVAKVFHEMQTRRVHMAIVLDEYGGTAGLVTIEDLLEEIVGQIQDEYDTAEAPEIEAVADNVYVVDGGVSIGTIDELLDVDLSSETYDTVGGLIYSRLGATPDVGASTQVGPVKATVEAMDGRRVRRVKIELVASSNAEKAGQEGEAS